MIGRLLRNKVAGRVALFFLILSGIEQSSFAQSHTYVVRDLESWTSLQMNFKLNKKFKFGLEQSLRLDHNSTQYNQLFTNVHGAYKLNDFFRLKTGFRLLNEPNNEGQNINHFRYFFSGDIKHKASNFTFKHRLMYTNKNELGISKSDGDVHVNNLRLLTSAKYNIKNWKLDPMLSTEVFRKYKDGEAEWNKVRFRLSTELKMKSFGKFEGFYAIEKEFGKSLTPTNYILGLSYVYTFKLYKNEK